MRACVCVCVCVWVRVKGREREISNGEQQTTSMKRRVPLCLCASDNADDEATLLQLAHEREGDGREVSVYYTTTQPTALLEGGFIGEKR